jgi:nitroimidazol reductase NimA-like FMN-containing flavoprotein (pyridoxamine 5'-phosphate oxidase superfamily)
MSGTKCDCRIGLPLEEPFVVPVCFGYENKSIYIHPAGEGKRLESLK